MNTDPNGRTTAPTANVPLSAPGTGADRGHLVASQIFAMLEQSRVVPVVTVHDVRTAHPLAVALTAGALPVAEVTLRTPEAVAAIAGMAAVSGMLVGAGTVLTQHQVDSAIAAGARFVVTPGLSRDVVQHCLDAGVPVLPGVATASEVQLALEMGLTHVKFFPAENLGGPAMIRALAGPFPQVRFVPTGGINLTNVASYLATPHVLAVGGSWMVTADLLRLGAYAEITRLAQHAHGAANNTESTKKAVSCDQGRP